MFCYENRARREGFQFIIGVDEAGCGPLAGPVVAAAVILTKRRFKNRVNDSKKLTPRMRARVFQEILDNSFVGIGIINEAGIDTLNILKASHMAMERSLAHLFSKIKKQRFKKKRFSFKRACVFIDGRKVCFRLPCAMRTIIGGDAQSFTVACASIVAKVTRDRIMAVYDQIYPQYGFSRHKGYPTRKHIEALAVHGPTAIHRKTFGPVQCLEPVSH